MASIRETGKILRPLLRRHDDLALIGRLVVVTPVRHHLRAVIVDRERAADGLGPHWFFYNLYHPRLGFHLSWGMDIYPRVRGAWSTSAPGVSEELCHRIEHVALPILRPVETFEQFAATVLEGQTLPGQTSPYWQLFHPDDRMLLHCAMGEWDAARTIWKQYYDRDFVPNPRRAEEDEYAGLNRLRTLFAADDRAGIIAALHEWEAATVRKLKLDPWWQPTPFPAELQS